MLSVLGAARETHIPSVADSSHTPLAKSLVAPVRTVTTGHAAMRLEERGRVTTIGCCSESVKQRKRQVKGMFMNIIITAGAQVLQVVPEFLKCQY
jgi:hypothetical protein